MTSIRATRCSRTSRSTRSTRTTSHLVLGSSGIQTARTSRSFAAGTACSTIGRSSVSWSRCSSIRSTRNRSKPTSRKRRAILGPSQGTFPTDPALNSGRVDILTPAVRALHQLGVSAGNRAAEYRHGDVGQPEPQAARVPSVQLRLRTRSAHGLVGGGRLHPHGGPRYVPQPEPEHRARDRHRARRSAYEPGTRSVRHSGAKHRARRGRLGNRARPSACSAPTTATTSTMR